MGERVFISYARCDQAVADRLYEDLAGTGLDVWQDNKRLSGGQNWRHEIQKAIEGSGFFIALLSRQALSKRGYVQAELKTAFEILKQVPIDERFLIPVRLEECVPSDRSLRDLQWIDLFESYSRGVRELQQIIRGTGVGKEASVDELLTSREREEFLALVTTNKAVRQVADYVMEDYLEYEGIELRLRNAANQRVRSSTRRALISLARRQSVEILVPGIVETCLGPKNLRSTISRETVRFILGGNKRN